MVKMKLPSLLAAGFPRLSAKLSLLLAVPLLLLGTTLSNSDAPFTFNNTGSLNNARYYLTATLLPNGTVLVAGGENSSGVLASAELYDPVSGTWTVTGSLNTGRYGHTATLLPNGKVLVAGGYNGVTQLASAELYDPASGTWTVTGSLNTGRTDYTATLLRDGKVLVVGGAGISNNILASAELYDPASETWTLTGSLNTGRFGHTAALLPNGKVLVVGGASSDGGGGITSAELYDPASGTWTATGNLNTGRLRYTATLLPNGIVLVAGGLDSSNNALASAELYDPASGTWTATGNLMIARYEHMATLLPDGEVLVAGGNDSSNNALASAELYDPANGTWASTGSLNTARDYHTATLLPNGKVLVAGGFDSSNNALASAELYEPASGTWTVTGNLNTARYAHTATLLPNGKVLVSGGDDSGASAELYDPASGTWTATGSLNIGRYQHQLYTATLLPNGKVLVAGGYNGAYLDSAELYDPASGTWTATGSLNIGRAYHTATLLPNGKVLVAGGYNNGNAIASAELYDPANGSWTITGSLNTAREAHTATLLPNGKVLAAGGYNGGALASAELYDPASATWTATGSVNTGRFYHAATLLPNGKVLLAGGEDSTFITLASAELYDPASGNWTITGSLNTAREVHTATLLPNGEVLVAGGYNNGNAIASAELYDPANETWTATGSLNTSRYYDTATLLPNSKVLVAGGYNNGNAIVSAELYDIGLGFVRPDWQPQIATVTSPLILGSSLTLTGSRFQGISQASGGNFQDSSTNYPVVQLRNIDNSQLTFLPVDPAAGWSDTSFTSIPVNNFPNGPAIVTVFTNGIPSDSKYLVVAPGPPPIVNTNAATNVTISSARLNGTVNPNGLPTSVHFEYGTTTSYGSTTTSQNYTGNTTQSVSAGISGLNPNTTYHFRLVGTNNGGTSYGSDMTFTTLSATGPPIVTTNVATNVTSSSATLNGTVNPNGLTTSVHFEYGTTANYGSATAIQNYTGNTTQSVSANITGLSPSTTYHFRIVASNNGGTTNGGDRTFTTLSATGPPIVNTNAATNVTSSSATLNGTVNPHGLTTSVYFQYGTTTGYGSTTAASQNYTGNTTQSVSADITGLSPNTTYHFRLVGMNSAGTRFSGDMTFTTLEGPPIISTNAATNVTSFSARLNGTVNPNGLTTSVHFQYGTTTSYGSITATQTFYTTHSVSANITGLSPNTTYHFRLVGSNSSGTIYGYDVTFRYDTTGLVIITHPATNITSSSATLNGTVNPNGLTTSVYFQYGASASYGFTTAAQSYSGSTTLPVSANIPGLGPNTTYHFRLVGANNGGTSFGGDRMFTTLGAGVPPGINSPGTATATVGQLFVYQVTATNGPTSYTAAPVPQGMTFDGVRGILGGTLMNPGTTQIHLTASNSAGTSIPALLALIAVQPLPPPGPVIASGTSITARTGQFFSFEVFTTGGSPMARLTATHLPPGLSADPGTGVIAGTPTANGSFGVMLTVTDGSVTTTSTLQLTFTSDPAIPVISSPREATLVQGQFFSYRIVDSSQQSGTTFGVTGQLPPGLTLNPVTGIISGVYNSHFQNGGPLLGSFQTNCHNHSGNAISPVTFFGPRPCKLLKISTRGVVQSGNNQLVGGVNVAGNANAQEKVMVRALGPSLVNVPLPLRLQNPTLELRNAANSFLGRNDDWHTTQLGGVITSNQVTDIQNSRFGNMSLAPTNQLESAMIANTLAPGNYSAIVRRNNGTTGVVGSVEFYDLGTVGLNYLHAAGLADFATRGRIQTGNNVINVMRSDFTLGRPPGTGSARRILLRARGPSLENVPLPMRLQNPTLQLYNGSGMSIRYNNDWMSAPNKKEIIDSGLAPHYPHESAILMTLNAGNYTAEVRGNNNTIGIAQVEAYILQDPD
jgi:uncharacterized delta-60 repeat protein